MLNRISHLIPVKGRFAASTLLLALAMLFCPFDIAGIPTLCSWSLESAGKLMPYYPIWMILLLKALSSLAFMFPGGVLAVKIFRPASEQMPSREVSIGDMTFSETALFTNIMITGAIGSGKTSSAIYPILEQICNIYSVPDEETSPNDPYKKFGGLVMDVKGDFYEVLICMMHWAGRNVLEAVQMSVNPEVIETPVVSAVAKDGIS